MSALKIGWGTILTAACTTPVRDRRNRQRPPLRGPRLGYEHPAARQRTPTTHAIIEHVIADLKDGPLRHLPSGSFAANSAWLVLAAMA
jgi:hypothetical protein